jgi:hypothetical protein
LRDVMGRDAILDQRAEVSGIELHGADIVRPIPIDTYCPGLPASFSAIANMMLAGTSDLNAAAIEQTIRSCNCAGRSANGGKSTLANATVF